MIFDCFSACCNRSGYQQIGTTGPRFGVRHMQCILVFSGLAVAYSMRVNLSVAIVAMTDRNASNPNFPEFDWDEGVKSYLLSSFFWGYVVTQIPGGYLSAIYGAKYMLFFSVLICSCLALLTPFCALTGGWKLVVLLRASQGLCQGVIFPSIHTFISKWAPTEERGGLVGFCYSGSQFGTVIMLSASGFIAASFLGWPSTFYIPGCVGIVWALVWIYYSASTPAEHMSITPTEQRYIETSGQARRPSDTGRNLRASQRAPTPWLHIFTSPPFVTLVISHCANNWGFWGLLTEIPSFMKNVLGMNLRSNGPLSALPYLAMCLLTYCFIGLSSLFKRRGSTMSLSFSRKFFNTLGMWLPMLMLIGLGYITTRGDSNVKWAIALLTLAVATNAATYLGFHVNHIDLSPNYAGTLMGISNCCANCISILAPLVIGAIVTDEKSPTQWRFVFYLTAFIYFMGNLLFILFGRTNVQSWNSLPHQTADTETLLPHDNMEEQPERASLCADS